MRVKIKKIKGKYMTPEDLINEIREKYSEYIEMYEDTSEITCRILAALLIKERQNSEYSKKLLKDIIK